MPIAPQLAASPDTSRPVIRLRAGGSPSGSSSMRTSSPSSYSSSVPVHHDNAVPVECRGALVRPWGFTDTDADQSLRHLACSLQTKFKSPRVPGDRPYHEVFEAPHSPSSWDRCRTGSPCLMVRGQSSRCILLIRGNQMLSYTGAPRGASRRPVTAQSALQHFQTSPECCLEFTHRLSNVS